MVAYSFWSLKKKIIPIVITTLIVFGGFSTTPYTLNYGDDMEGNIFQIMESEKFYTNIKEPSLMIKNNLLPTDKIIYDPMENLYMVYLDKEPNWRVGWPEPKDYKSIEEYRKISSAYNTIPDDTENLEEIIKSFTENGERIWLIEASYNNINLKSRVRKGNIRKFLDNGAQKCLYYSKDYSRVFLFDKNCWSAREQQQ